MVYSELSDVAMGNLNSSSLNGFLMGWGFWGLIVFMSGTPSIAHAGIAVQDDSAHRVELAQPAQRVVALAPSLAELVFAAGGGERLVGVSRYSDFPERAKDLPVVSDAFAVNLEALSKLKPDLVLLWSSGTSERQRSAVKHLAARQGFAVFESDIQQVEGIAHTLQRLGQLMKTSRVADVQAQTVLTQWQALAPKPATRARPVRVFVQVWSAPLMTLNAQHVLTQAIHRCGGVTGFDDLPVISPSVNKEAVLAFNPELILTDESASDERAASGVVKLNMLQPVRWPASAWGWKRLISIKAVQTEQVWGLRAQALTRMTPRFLAAAAQVCERINALR
jgi:iron complex transport system substrate-binding protein